MPNILSELKVILGIESKGFHTVESQFKKFSNSLEKDFEHIKTAVAGYFTADVLKELVRGGMELIDNWKDVSEYIGESTDEVQRLDAAFRKVGVSIDVATRAISTLNEKRKKALGGGQEEMNLFQSFGISEEELKKTQGIALFRKMAEGAGRGGEQKTLWTELFGNRVGGKLMAAAGEMDAGNDVNIISKEDIDKLHESNIALTEAIIQLKLEAAKIALGMVSKAEKVYHPTTENEETTKSLREQAQQILKGKYSKEDKAAAQEYLGQTSTSFSVGRAWSDTFFGKSKIPLISGLATAGKAIWGAAKGNTPSQTFPEWWSASGPEATGMWQQKFAAIRKGASYSPLSNYPNLVKEKPMVFGPGAEQQKKIDSEMQDAIDKAFLRTGNASQKREILGGEIERKRKEAEDLEKQHKWDEAAKVRKDIVGLAAEKVGLEKDSRLTIPADARAAVGGFIGGATAGIDPSLLAAQDQVALLRQILEKVGIIQSGTKPNPAVIRP